MVVFNVAERQSLEGREGINNAIGDSAAHFPRCAMQKERSHCEKCGNRLYGMEAADPPHGGREAIEKSAPEPVFGPFWAPNSPGNQKVDNVIGNILDIVLLNSPMHRAITSHR